MISKLRCRSGTGFLFGHPPSDHTWQFSRRQRCMTHAIWVVVSNTFYIDPYVGKWSNSTIFFADGLKPPSRNVCDWPQPWPFPWLYLWAQVAKTRPFKTTRSVAGKLLNHAIWSSFWDAIMLDLGCMQWHMPESSRRPYNVHTSTWYVTVYHGNLKHATSPQLVVTRHRMIERMLGNHPSMW